MKHLVLVTLIIVGFACSASAQVSENLYKYLATESSLETVADKLTFEFESLNSPYAFSTASYDGNTLASFSYETYGRANGLGHPVSRIFESSGLTIIHITFEGIKEMRANTISRDMLWVINESGKITQLDIQAKVVGDIKLVDDKIQFLNFDHPHSYITFLYVIDPLDINTHNYEAFDMSTLYQTAGLLRWEKNTK